jgi:dUTP pyrophosphatase
MFINQGDFLWEWSRLKMKIKVKKLRENAVLPKYARLGDAAMDVVAVDKEVCDNFVEYKTGLAFEIPEGHVMLIFPRSSCTKSDLILGNGVGVLDSGYRGELIVRFNFLGKKGHYEVGDRIAQIMILPYPEFEFDEVEALSESERGEGRFGSTGR